jgi:hypothetical protein
VPCLRAVLPGIVALALGASSCADDAASEGAADDRAGGQSTVFAAASLTDAFETIGEWNEVLIRRKVELAAAGARRGVPFTDHEATRIAALTIREDAECARRLAAALLRRCRTRPAGGRNDCSH